MGFLAGLVGGVSSSMPIGPINLILIGMASRPNRAMVAFVFGVCLADGTLAALSTWGSLHILLAPGVATALGAVCASLMLAYGAMSWRAKPPAGTPRDATGMLRAAGLGFALCILNPLFSLFWISYIMGFREAFAMTSIGIPGFVGGVVAGDLIWFTAVALVAARLLSRRGPRFLDRMRRVTSVIILLFSGYLFSVVLFRGFDV
jgi:threonine/homoserine/homoserine lactone efflux protein